MTTFVIRSPAQIMITTIVLHQTSRKVLRLIICGGVSYNNSCHDFMSKIFILSQSYFKSDYNIVRSFIRSCLRYRVHQLKMSNSKSRDNFCAKALCPNNDGNNCFTQNFSQASYINYLGRSDLSQELLLLYK
jgi:hypothetical protein